MAHCLSISDLDGAIVGVTLTSFGGETKTGAPAAIVKADCAVGLPIVSGVAVGATIVDERRDVSMHFQGEHVYILLSTDIVKPGCVGADRLRFFVEGDQLVAVGFGPLAKEEHDELVRRTTNHTKVRDAGGTRTPLGRELYCSHCTILQVANFEGWPGPPSAHAEIDTQRNRIQSQTVVASGDPVPLARSRLTIPLLSARW